MDDCVKLNSFLKWVKREKVQSKIVVVFSSDESKPIWFELNLRPQQTHFLLSLMTVSLFKLFSFLFFHNFILFHLCSLWEENPTKYKLLVLLFKTTRLLVWSRILKHVVEIFKRTRSQTRKTDLEWKGKSTLLTLPWLRFPKDLPDNTSVDHHQGFRVKRGHIWWKGG